MVHVFLTDRSIAVFGSKCPNILTSLSLRFYPCKLKWYYYTLILPYGGFIFIHLPDILVRYFIIRLRKSVHTHWQTVERTPQHYDMPKSLAVFYS